MNLDLHTPTDVLVSEPVEKIIAEASNGSFCLLPRHTDFLSTLVPGLFMYLRPSGEEVFLANAAGLLVNAGRMYLSRFGKPSRGTIWIHYGLPWSTSSKFWMSSRVCQSAIASLEANFLRRFLDLEKRQTS